MKILVAGSGNGKGIAMDNKTKRNMIELQAALGMGVKKFSVVFVFDTHKAFNDFVNSGGQFGGQANASATTGPKVKAGAGEHYESARTGSGCIK